MKSLRVLSAAAVCALSATACAPSAPAEPPEPENVPPVAHLSIYGGTTHARPFGVIMNATGSYDPDGNIVAAEVDLGNGHTMQLPLPGSGVAEKAYYSEFGTYTVTLTVTDDDGATATDSSEVTIIPDDDGLPV